MTAGRGRGVLVVFAKAPTPGRVKTRMTPPLSPEQATGLYESMLGDVVEASARFARELALTPVLAVHPPEACEDLIRPAPAGFRAVAQRGRDLGERMCHAASEWLASGVDRVLLRGSDSPTLALETVAVVLEGLDEVDLAVCPDQDGGYNLIGLREPVRNLFDHPMSTGSVLRDTLANADAQGLRSFVTEPGFDLDTAADLERLERARERGEATLCPRTLAYLDGHALWPR